MEEEDYLFHLGIELMEDRMRLCWLEDPFQSMAEGAYLRQSHP